MMVGVPPIMVKPAPRSVAHRLEQKGIEIKEE
jgi:hypothetical protein